MHDGTGGQVNDEAQVAHSALFLSEFLNSGHSLLLQLIMAIIDSRALNPPYRGVDPRNLVCEAGHAFNRMGSRLCPLCGRRKACRTCPALGHQICPLCCGTKRLVEIRCPSDCGYLATARVHPPAVAQRRQERDVSFLGPIIHDLAEPQYHLFVLIQMFLRAYRPATVPAIIDDDVAAAAGALAATLETAGRGIIYEHRPSSLPAQRLATDMKAALDQGPAQGYPSRDRDAVVVLRRIERAAQAAQRTLGGGQTAYLDLLERVFREPGPQSAPEPPPTAEGGSGLIIP